VRCCFALSFCHFLFGLRLLDQFQSNVDLINCFNVINVTDSDAWLLRTLEYSRICRFIYFVVICHWHRCFEYDSRFILFVFNEFVWYQCILSI